MSGRTNIINNILSLGITILTFFAFMLVGNSNYPQEILPSILYMLGSAIFAGLLNAFAHELGHLIAGKKNGFVFSAMVVWFFRWMRVRKKVRFDFVMMGNEAGYTEMIPSSTDSINERYRKMTMGGIIASFIVMLLGVPPMFLNFLPVWLFYFWGMLLPLGAYYFFGSALPMSSYGVRNDGAVIYGLKKMDFTSTVTVALLSAQAEMYEGKTPFEVGEKWYFDLPQLCEEDPVFIQLLNARYNYYLDKEDYTNAKNVTARLMELIDDMPKEYRCVVQTDALYNACTFDFDEEVADDLTSQLEKYLNNVNTVTTVRVKTAYLLYVKGEKEKLEVFYKKALKEADRCQIKGYGRFERRLIEKMIADSKDKK